jgi:hypothetical protein
VVGTICNAAAGFDDGEDVEDVDGVGVDGVAGVDGRGAGAPGFCGVGGVVVQAASESATTVSGTSRLRRVNDMSNE